MTIYICIYAYGYIYAHTHICTHIGQQEQEISTLVCLRDPAACTPERGTPCPGLVRGTETSNSGREEPVPDTVRPHAGGTCTWGLFGAEPVPQRWSIFAPESNGSAYVRPVELRGVQHPQTPVSEGKISSWGEGETPKAPPPTSLSGS